MLKWLMKKAENTADTLFNAATKNFNKPRVPKKDDRTVKHPK